MPNTFRKNGWPAGKFAGTEIRCVSSQYDRV